MAFDLTNEKKKESALLIAVDTGDYDCEVSMQELCELTATAGAEVMGQMIQKRPTVEAATFVGKGRLEEIKELYNNREIEK